MFQGHLKSTFSAGVTTLAATTEAVPNPTTEKSPSDEPISASCEVGRELVGEGCADCQLNFYKGEGKGRVDCHFYCELILA